MSDLHALLDAADEELAPLARRQALASWDVAVDATDEREEALVEASLALEGWLADRDRYETLRAAEADANGKDRLDRRRIALLRRRLEAHQRPPELAERIVRAEAALQALYANHRGRIGEREVSSNEIENILRTSRDLEERRAAWDASRSVGPLAAPRLRELVRLRNEAARRLGYRDHFELAVALDELDEDWLMGLLDRLDALLEPAWEREKAAIDGGQRQLLGVPASEPLRPWHYADPFFQEPTPVAGDMLPERLADVDPLPLVRAYFEALGDPVADVLARSDLYPRTRKDQGAFCMQIDRGPDVRVLANVEPGERWLGVMLHELGHAVYDVALDPELPWSLRTAAHVFTTEAIAMLHGRRVRDGVFLARFTPLDEDEASDPVHELVLRRSLHVFVPWVQVMTRFERALYADPDADLGTLWWQLVRRHQRITPPEDPRPDDWAAKLHLAVSPVYYHNYLLGEIAASQLEWAIARETGDPSPAADPAAAGAFLRERFMRPGSSLRWDELMERATGEPLTPDHLAGLLTA